MTFDELLLEAKMAEIDREVTGAALARTVAELYGPYRCDSRPGKARPTSERHAVDPGHFRRLVWAGLGS